MYLQQVFRSCLNMRFTVMCGIIDLQSSTLTCTESALRLVYTLVSVAPDLVFLGDTGPASLSAGFFKEFRRFC